MPTPEPEPPEQPAGTAWRQTLGYYGLFVCAGVSTALVGPTLPDLARQTGASVASLGWILFAGAAGNALGTFAGGRLYDRGHGHLLLGGAQLAAAACIAAVPAIPSLWLLVAVVLCRGLAEGLINTGANTLLFWTHGARASPFVNGLHFFFGVGAFLAPFGVARLAAGGGYRIAYWGAAALAALAAANVLSTRARLAGRPAPAAADRRGDRSSARAALIAIAGLYLFTYVSAELSFGNWLYTYALALGLLSTAGAAYLTSGFWLSFTVGRLVSIPAAVLLAPRHVISIALTACLVFSGLMLVLPPSVALLWTATLGLGFFMAPLWPSGFTLAGQVMPLTAFASGLVLLGDSLGGMVLPSITGKVIEVAGMGRLASSLPVLVFGSLALCAFTFASLLAAARRSRAAQEGGAPASAPEPPAS